MPKERIPTNEEELQALLKALVPVALRKMPAIFCRIRSYMPTMQKQGHPLLSALTVVFHGQPLPVAWGPE